MADKSDILLALFKDNKEYARHNERIRTTLCQIFIAVSSLLLGLIGLDRNISITDLPASLMIIGLGVFGAVISYKHYERVRLHLNRAATQLAQLDNLLADVDIQKGRRESYGQNERMFPFMYKRKLNRLWLGPFVLISLLGFSVSAIIVWPFIDRCLPNAH